MLSEAFTLIAAMVVGWLVARAMVDEDGTSVGAVSDDGFVALGRHVKAWAPSSSKRAGHGSPCGSTPSIGAPGAECLAPNVTRTSPYLLSLEAFHLRRTSVADFRMCCCRVAADPSTHDKPKFESPLQPWSLGLIARAVLDGAGEA